MLFIKFYKAVNETYQVSTHKLCIEFVDNAALSQCESIDRIELWKVMDENEYPKKLRLIKITKKGIQNYVRIWDKLSSSLESHLEL